MVPFLHIGRLTDAETIDITVERITIIEVENCVLVDPFNGYQKWIILSYKY